MRIVTTILLGCLMFFGRLASLSADEKSPADKRDLAATVLGKEIYLEQITPSEAPEKQKELSAAEYRKWLRDCRTTALLSRISVAVLNEYALREKLTPTEEEINAEIAAGVVERAARAAPDKDGKRNLAIQAAWLWASSLDWRVTKALYEKYGGHVAVSSFGGCASFEGRNAVLKEYADAGEIKFADAELELAFWEKTKDKRILDVTLQPSSVASFFAISPWERWRKEGESQDKKDTTPP